MALSSTTLDRLSERELEDARGLRLAVIHCGFTYSGGGERLVLEQGVGRAHGRTPITNFSPFPPFSS